MFEVPLRFLMSPENHATHTRLEGQAALLLCHALRGALYLGRDRRDDQQSLRPHVCMTRCRHSPRARWLNDPALQQVFAARGRGGRRSTRGRRGGAQCAVGRAGRRYRHRDDAAAAGRDDGRQGGGLSVHPTGIEHGTVTLVVDHRPFEVTTLRRDVETMAAARVVPSPMTGRPMRCGATSRSMRSTAAAGEIFDPVEGYADILRKRISFVGALGAHQGRLLAHPALFPFSCAYER